MKKIPLQLLLTSLLSASAPTVFAVCQTVSMTNIQLNGQVLHVANKTPIGSIIGEIYYEPSKRPQGVNDISALGLCDGHENVKIEIAPKWESSGMLGTYRTGLNGVGMRITNPYNTSEFIPSLNQVYPQTNGMVTIPRFKIQFVKIAKTVEPGKVYLGPVMHFKLNGNNAKTVQVGEITIKAEACEVDSYDTLVSLPRVPISSLKNGELIGHTDFTINVTCHNTAKKPAISFSLPNANQVRTGEVPFSSSSIAKGAVFYVEKDLKPIEFNRNIPIKFNGSNKATIPMSVAYKKSGNEPIEAGTASGLMNFELKYN